MTNKITNELRERVLAASESETPLDIRGSGSKSFLGRRPAGELDRRARIARGKSRRLAQRTRRRARLVAGRGSPAVSLATARSRR